MSRRRRETARREEHVGRQVGLRRAREEKLAKEFSAAFDKNYGDKGGSTRKSSPRARASKPRKYRIEQEGPACGAFFYLCGNCGLEADVNVEAHEQAVQFENVAHLAEEE